MTKRGWRFRIWRRSVSCIYQRKVRLLTKSSGAMYSLIGLVGIGTGRGYTNAIADETLPMWLPIVVWDQLEGTETHTLTTKETVSF